MKSLTDAPPKKIYKVFKGQCKGCKANLEMDFEIKAKTRVYKFHCPLCHALLDVDNGDQSGDLEPIDTNND